MEKLNYVVVSSTNNIGGSVNDTDMYFPFTGNKNGMKPPKSFAKTKKEIWGYITEDEFSGMDDLTYLGFDGDYYVYADGAGKKFFSNIGKGIVKGIKGAGKGIGSAAKWVGKSVKELVTKWGKRINERRTARKNRKSRKQEMAYKVAMEKAKAQGLSDEQAKKIASDAEAKVRAEQESLIAAAESRAYEKGKAEGKPTEQIEQAANKAGEEAEKQIYGGYLASEDKGFWKSMGVGGKIAIIGGGTLLIGLIVYLVVKKK
jgi:hypothetical protein